MGSQTIAEAQMYQCITSIITHQHTPVMMINKEYV